MSTLTRALLLLTVPCLFPGTSFGFSLSLDYGQDSNFWGVLHKITNGVSDIGAANSLLNETYGKPTAAEASLLCRADPTTEFSLREFRVDQVGYAVSSNPILPKLYGWEGLGASAVIGYHFLEVYGGGFLGKRADAVSTDLIDRSLVQADDLALAGFGLNYHYVAEQDFGLPLGLDVYSRHTQFFSKNPEFKNLWQVTLSWRTELGTVFVRNGQIPIPGMEQNSVIWNYLWQTQTFPDLLAMMGFGYRTPALPIWNAEVSFGDYSGYFGVEFALHPSSKLEVDLRSYEYETVAAYLSEGLRMYALSVRYSI